MRYGAADIELMADPALQTHCAFCRIARGEELATVVCATDECVAFFPETPATPGHTLVIPRQHIQNFLLLESQLACHLVSMVIRVGRAIERALNPEGMNLITSAGAAATQTVPHVHFHVVPRWFHDEIGDIWPPKKAMNRDLEENLAERISAACEEL